MKTLHDTTGGTGALRRAARTCSCTAVPAAASAAARTTALLTLAAAFALAGCGGAGGGASNAEPTATAQAQALALSQPGDLARYVQNKLRARDAQLVATPNISLDKVAGTVFSQSPSAAAPTPVRSGTLLQEAGVDEPDLLQSDGTHFYSLHPELAGGQLQAHVRAADGSVSRLATLALPVDKALSVDLQGMVLSSDARALAVLSQRWLPMEDTEVCAVKCEPLLGLPFAPVWWRSTVTVQRVDISTPAQAQLGERISIDGRLVDSRRIGDALYVVSSHRPRLATDVPPASATAAAREAAIAGLTATDVLPQMRRNGGPATPLLADTDCWTQPRNAAFDINVITITVFDLKSPTLAPVSRCFVGGSEALYMTQNSLYLATSRSANYPLMVALSSPSGAPSALPIRYPDQTVTDIHKFTLASGVVSYRASGEVPGHLGWNPEMKALRMSEFNGDLRVLSFTGSLGWTGGPDPGDVSAPPPSPAQLTVLRERVGEQVLAAVASLPNAQRPAPIGKPGEQLHGVRFVGDRAYAVTFRVVDPLYVLDLSNPLDPRLAGALEVPGFSDQLFALDNGLLLGVGRDVTAAGRLAGIKVALFDVMDAQAPRQLASQVLGAQGSLSALNVSRHGLNLLLRDGVARVALPVNLSQPGTPDWTQGLQRFEVDTRARTLKPMPARGQRSSAFYQTVGMERSLQIGEQIYYLSQGSVTAYNW